jgi:SAM-dependent methyltransferase
MELYDKNFYAEQSSGSINSAKQVVPFIAKILPNINSVIDVGCGVGGWLKEWKLLRKTIFGIDGNELSENDRKILNREYIKSNLEFQLPELKSKFDLCMSLEVAEHLTPERGNGGGGKVSFIKDICSYSDIVLFSAAIPGQTGVNHINEQWQSYWADIFYQRGYKPYDILRDHFWNNSDVAWWYSQNMILYSKIELNAVPASRVLDRVHPRCLEMYYKKENSPFKKEDLSYIQKAKRKAKKILKTVMGRF